jgi:hypothetical protein
MQDFLEAVRKALAAARATPVRAGPEDRRPAEAEYAIAGSFGEFMIWRSGDREGRSNVIYLPTAERAEQAARAGSRGVLHRIGSWRTSPARDAAERLELAEDHP